MNEGLKVGDRVRVIAARASVKVRFIGNTGEITGAGESPVFPYAVRFDGERLDSAFLFGADELELIEEESP